MAAGGGVPTTEGGDEEAAAAAAAAGEEAEGGSAMTIEGNRAIFRRRRSWLFRRTVPGRKVVVPAP
jgi:hypothetical protein